SVFQTISSVCVSSVNVAPANASSRGAAPFDFARVRTAPLLKSIRLMPLNVKMAAVVPLRAMVPTGAPSILIDAVGVLKAAVLAKKKSEVAPSLVSCTNVSAFLERGSLRRCYAPVMLSDRGGGRSGPTAAEARGP